MYPSACERFVAGDAEEFTVGTIFEVLQSLGLHRGALDGYSVGLRAGLLVEILALFCLYCNSGAGSWLIGRHEIRYSRRSL